MERNAATNGSSGSDGALAVIAMNPRLLHEANRLSWNAATRAHNSHKLDQAGFFRAGKSTLFPEEMELLGDVRGLDLVHLQCNAGQDTLSLAVAGATVTGVDISDEAIDFAGGSSWTWGPRRQPGRRSFGPMSMTGWRKRGSRRCVLTWPFHRMDRSVGCRTWSSGRPGWRPCLRPTGRVVLVDFHPAGMMFDEEWHHRYPYSTGGQPLRHDSG